MRILEQVRLADALSAWGRHEAVGRLQLPNFLAETQHDPLAAMEVVLNFRAPLVHRLLAARPVKTFRVQLEPDDISYLILADGRAVNDWLPGVAAEQNAGGQYIRTLAASAEKVSGPLFCSVQQNTEGQLTGSITLFDGWHRVAAWVLQCRNENDYPITAHLVVTQHAAQLLGA